MTRLMTVLVAVFALTACETEEEIEMWEAALAESSQARGEFEQLDEDEDLSDGQLMDCAERLRRFGNEDDRALGNRFAPAPIPARGNLACGQHAGIFTNGTNRTKACTIEYMDQCGSSVIEGGIGGTQSLQTSQNGNTSDIEIDVAPGQTLTFVCAGSGGFDDKSKCTYKTSCKDAPQKQEKESDDYN